MSLSGRRVVITRPEDDIDELAAMLRERGAEPIEAPAIEILPLEEFGPLDSSLRSLAAGQYAWVVFSSPRAVDAVADRFSRLALAFAPAQRIAAVGPATARAIREELRAEPDFVAEPYTTDALTRGLPPANGERVLLPRADIAPHAMEEGLRSRGYVPVRVNAYRTRIPPHLPPRAREALRARTVDAVVFTSASTVRGFATMAGGMPRNAKVVCIGPVTAAEARRSGFEVHAVAEPHTMPGIVAALDRLFVEGTA